MEPRQFLEIMGTVGRLKDVTRHSYTEKGRHESVAEHTFRLVLMAYFLKDEFADVDIQKVMLMCAVHDIGEAFTGDIPSFDKTNANEAAEERLLDEWVSGLPGDYAGELMALYKEMNERKTTEAKLYKALDGLEAVMQHNEADISTWIEREYELNLTYAYDKVAFSDYLVSLRDEIRADTQKKLAKGCGEPEK